MVQEFVMSTLLQRIFASVLLLVCVGLALMAWPYQAAFSYEPVGPRAFPLLMLALMGAALLYMVFRPARSNTVMTSRHWTAKP
jgi:putative tricarboxylic transport membrane protein